MGKLSNIQHKTDSFNLGALVRSWWPFPLFCIWINRKRWLKQIPIQASRSNVVCHYYSDKDTSTPLFTQLGCDLFTHLNLLFPKLWQNGLKWDFILRQYKMYHFATIQVIADTIWIQILLTYKVYIYWNVSSTWEWMSFFDLVSLSTFLTLIWGWIYRCYKKALLFL